MRIAIIKEAFNSKISLLTSKLNIELGKKLVVLCMEHCFILLRHQDEKKIGAEVFLEPSQYRAGGEWRKYNGQIKLLMKCLNV